MGQTLSAKLYYGFPLEEEPDFDYCDANDKWDELVGPTKPTSNDYKTKEWDEWRKSNAVYEKSVDKVEIDFGGWDGGQLFYIHCPGVEIEAPYGASVLIENGLLMRYNHKLNEFCNEFNIPYKTPDWYLVARLF